MGYECEVVVVKTANGPVRVNKSDYDADPKAYGSIDKGETETATQTPAVAENVTTQNAAPQYFVQKEGRKFFVFNLTGQKAADDAGYKTEDDAREAMKGLTD
jgi:hypothetical protein